MNNLSVFSFENQEVRFVDGKPVANDVATVLGYADPAKTISTKVKDKHKGVCKIVTPGGMQSVMVLEEEGVLQLVSSSRLPNALQLAKQMGVKIMNCTLEQQFISVIESSFLDLKPIRQFSVGCYRVDLYLSIPNIAVECDEKGHLHYSCEKERERERKIFNALNCTFVRFNPDSPNFNIGNVIRKIREAI